MHKCFNNAVFFVRGNENLKICMLDWKHIELNIFIILFVNISTRKSRKDGKLTGNTQTFYFFRCRLENIKYAKTTQLFCPLIEVTSSGNMCHLSEIFLVSQLSILTRAHGREYIYSVCTSF